MCGICGFTGAPDSALLSNMGNVILHRGPDDCGTYEDTNISLCSRRLSIVDLAFGTQPVCNEDSSVLAVWNGEIYNYKELISNLKQKGHTFYSHHSDSEVIVHMYEEYGIDFVNHLNGMFAIALWDKKKQALFLIRDRMGVKPLFYYYNGTQLIFASEIKSILLHPAYKKEMNYAALYQYFSFHNSCSPSTAFTDIMALRPGTILQYRNGNKTLKKYWKLDFHEYSKDSFETAVEKTRSLLTDAVKLRLNADVEVGSFLSGGLDSSLVTAIAAQNSSSSLQTFCLGHEIADPGDLYHKEDDVFYAEEVASKYHTNHHLLTICADDVISNLEHIIHSFDQPFAGSISTFFLANFMSKHVKTALSGDGADELFGSYPLHQLAFPMQAYTKMKQHALPENFSLLKPFENRIDYLDTLYDFSDGNEILLSYRLLNMTDANKNMFLADNHFKIFEDKNMTLSFLKERYASVSAQDALNRALEYQWNSFLPDQVLSYTDSLSMAHSLEVRSPFLDYRLVEYVASLPGKYKIQNGETKYLLKRAAKGLLPKDLVFRKKEGFILPLHDWMRNELKEYVLDTLSPTALLNYGLLKEDNVLFLLHTYYTDPVKNDSLADIIWNLLIFQKWCELYF